MTDNFIITSSNFKDLAKQAYSATNRKLKFTYIEFNEDFKHFQAVSHLLKRYKEERDRLILNHIIILYNCFGKFTIYGLFFIVSSENWVKLKTFLAFLSIIPTSLPQFNLENDKDLFQRLENL